MKKLKRYQVILIIIGCMLFNFVGIAVTRRFCFPVWLGTVGTCFAASYTGMAGAIAAGVIPQMVCNLMNGGSPFYGVVSLIVAILIWLCASRGQFEEFSKMMMSGFWVGVITAIVSVPFNLVFLGGYTGNWWGDVLFDMLDWRGMPVLTDALAAAGIVEIVDKQICFLLFYGIRRLAVGIEKKGAVRAGAFFLVSTVMLSVLCPPVEALAKVDEESISDNFLAKIYDNSSGMMSSEANVIEETEDGYIWIGSYAGLTRFDGTEFKFERTGGITNVTCMLADSRGRLWIGTNDKGIACYENGKFSFLTEEDGLPVNSIRSFLETDSGTIYVGTTDRICKIEEENRIQVVEQNLSYVISMEYVEGKIVGVDNNGEIFALGEDDALIPIGKEFDDIFCYCVELTSKGLLMGAADNRVSLLEVGEDGVSLVRQLEDALEDVIAIEEDSSGRIWLCGENQLGFFDADGVFREQHYKNFDSAFEGICEDYQGNMWVASSRYGVMKLSQSRFLDLFEKAEADNKVVNAVVRYKDSLYCATDVGLTVIREDDYTVVQNELTEYLEGVRIRCLFVDSKGRLWACTYSDFGLVCYNPDAGSGRIASYTMEESGLTSNRVRNITELKDGTLVVGTADGINYIENNQVTQTITGEDGLLNSQILTLAQGEDGRVYAGSDGGGLYEISDKKIVQCYTTEDGLSSDVILRIVPYDGGFFIVTSNALCYKKDNIRVLEEFPYFNNYDVIVKGEYAYVLSSAGIYAVDAKTLCSGEKMQCRLYSVEDGLLSSLVANSWNCPNDDGTIYVCSNSGVVAFYEAFAVKQREYKYGITSVICDGETIPEQNDVYVLPKTAKNITLSASVRNYALQDVNACFYVEGNGKNEHETDSRLYLYDELGNMQISNLPSGEYKMHLQILNAEGDEVLQEKVYTLVKEKQVYEFVWYRIYLVVVSMEIIAFLIWTIVWLLGNSSRKEKLEIQRKDLEDKVAEQTEELRVQQALTKKLLGETVVALSDAVDAKDRYTSGHSKRVADYAKKIAERMGKTKEEQEDIYRSALLHDIGKIRVPESVINKTSKLTEEEKELMRIHPVTGYHILKRISSNPMIAQGAKFHHERYDGKGYPSGLSGDGIPEIARIIGVADAYDAMSSNRSYRRELLQEVVRAEIEKGKGTQFDPEIADIMLQMIDEDKDYHMKQNEGQHKKILVVDDEVMNVEMIEFIMEDEPLYEIYSVLSGKEALELLEKETFSVILLDVKMRGMDGFETLQKIREHYTVPVIFMTADKNAKTMHKMIQLGVDDYITKPFVPLVLKEVIYSTVNK